MEYAHEPGMLFFKMDDAFLEGITGTSGELTSEAAVGIIDTKGQLCFASVPEEFSLGKKRQADISERIAGSGSAGMILEGSKFLEAFCRRTGMRPAGWRSFLLCRTKF